MVRLTVDELRALARLTDLTLPRFVTTGDPKDLDVDVAALRGLAVRDLAHVTDDPGQPVRIAPPLAARLDPCRHARHHAELDIEADGTTTRYALLGTGPVAVLFTEEPGGLVRLDPAGTGPAEQIRALARLDQTAAVPAGSDRFEVAEPAHRDAEEHLLAGDDEAAVAALRRAGALETAARAWVAAVRGRRHAVALRVAVRANGFAAGSPSGLAAGSPSGFVAGEVRWLTAGDGTTWHLGLGPGPITVIGPVDGATLSSIVDGMFDGEP